MDGSPGKLWHDGHEAAQDIISAPIGASKAVDEDISELNEQFTGMDVHFPTWNEPFMDLTCHGEGCQVPWHQDDGKAGIRGPTKGRPGLQRGPIVSYNFHSDTYSSTSGAGSGVALNNNFVKLILAMTRVTEWRPS